MPGDKTLVKNEEQQAKPVQEEVGQATAPATTETPVARATKKFEELKIKLRQDAEQVTATTAVSSSSVIVKLKCEQTVVAAPANVPLPPWKSQPGKTAKTSGVAAPRPKPSMAPPRPAALSPPAVMPPSPAAAAADTAVPTLLRAVAAMMEQLEQMRR
jgi:hypothetical protein